MARILEVVTPENVAIRYELAGIGSRGMAAAIDASFQIVIYGLLIGVAGLLSWMKVIPSWDGLGESVLQGLLTLCGALVFWGYYLLFEGLWSGETPGKRMLGLRVVKDSGHPIDFRAVLVRNLIRIVDALPVYGVALWAAMSNAHYRRLGDMAAGTLVIRHGRGDDPLYLPGLGKAEVYRLIDQTVISQLFRLTREEYRMVQHFIERRAELPQPLRGQFALRLAQPLIEKFQYQTPSLGMDYERWLEELDLAYRTRALSGSAAPAAAPTPAVAETPPPPVAGGRKW